jgi:hypothetical protein
MWNVLYTIQFSIFYISQYFLRGLGTIDSTIDHRGKHVILYHYRRCAELLVVQRTTSMGYGCDCDCDCGIELVVVREREREAS